MTRMVLAPSPAPPANLTVCLDGPNEPGSKATQRDAALVILDFEEALADCKRKVTALVSIMNEAHEASLKRQ